VSLVSVDAVAGLSRAENPRRSGGMEGPGEVEDPAMAQVETVRGPVDAGRPETTFMHEHVFALTTATS
jgi:hypothetical protein